MSEPETQQNASLFDGKFYVILVVSLLQDRYLPKLNAVVIANAHISLIILSSSNQRQTKATKQERRRK
jgi:hypothetical protein